MIDSVSLEHLRSFPGGSAWLDALPSRIEAARRRWSLRLGRPFENVHESVVFPADLPDGTPVALKVRWPNRESVHEPTALPLWNGVGTVRLLDLDADLSALLLERCNPGTPLSTVGHEEAIDTFVALLPKLWVPAGEPFGTLADEAAILSAELVVEWERTGRPIERRLVDTALEAFATLAPTQGQPVLLHQDLHADNVLLAERGWLAIDPKPLAGEREFGIAPIVRSRELGHDRRLVMRRFDRLTGELGLDRARARGWTVAHAIAWCFEGDGVIETHVETARWLLKAAR